MNNMQQIIQYICMFLCGVSVLVFGIGISGAILGAVFNWDIEEDKWLGVGFVGLIFGFVIAIIGALTAQGANQ